MKNNKVINWLNGSIFRTLGRFIAYIIIFILIALISKKIDLKNILLIEKVNASVLPYNSAYLNANQCELVYAANDSLWYLRNCQWDSNNNIGNSITFGAQNGHLKKIEFNIKDSGDYEIGNYNLVFNWGIDPRNITEWNNKYNIKIYGSRNNGNDIELTSNCNTSLGSGNYDFNTSCNFSTLEKFDHFKILYDFYGGETCSSHINYGIACSDNRVMPINTNAMSFNSISVFEYDNNATSAINNQTQIIERNFIEVKESQEETKGLLRQIIDIFKTGNLEYLIIPTEQQMQTLLNDMQTKVNQKLGILGLPLTIYTRFMNLAQTETQENWCITWNNVTVPNFENETPIIQSGSWCFNTILENEKVNTFRTICINIIGGLIILSFIQYLMNSLHRVLDVPQHEEYEYITTEDVQEYSANGSYMGRQHRVRTTIRDQRRE